MTTTDTTRVHTYRPEPSVAKLRKTELRALTDILADAARETAEFAYLACYAEQSGERLAALDGARRCVDTARTYLDLLDAMMTERTDTPNE